MIPGNPGAATYYVPFMLALWDQFKGSAEVSALSQMGHGYAGSNKVDTKIGMSVDFFPSP